jgi:tetratricopeptide (TPR) repeat protein
LASQLFSKKQYEEAEAALQTAQPQNITPAARLLLGRTRYALARYQEAVETILPLYEQTRSRDAGKILAASHAALRDWTSALRYLEPLLAEATEISVLNQAAECYIHLEQPDRAVPLLERSISLNPGQPAIRELLEKLQKTVKKNNPNAL